METPSTPCGVATVFSLPFRRLKPAAIHGLALRATRTTHGTNNVPGYPLVILSPSLVILSAAKDLLFRTLRVNSAKDLLFNSRSGRLREGLALWALKVNSATPDLPFNDQGVR